MRGEKNLVLTLLAACVMPLEAMCATEVFRGVALVNQGDWPVEVWRAFWETPRAGCGVRADQVVGAGAAGSEIRLGTF